MAPTEQLLYSLKQAQAKKFGLPNGILDMAHEWKGAGENLLKSLADYIEEIDSREKNLTLVGESLEKRLKDLDERERDFGSFQERKKKELAVKERGLMIPVLKDIEGVELRERKLDEQLKLASEHIESLEAAQSEVEGLRLRGCEKLREIEKREREVDFMRRSFETRLREVAEREKELDSFQDRKFRELALEEEVLSRKREEFVRDVNLADEKFREREKMACGLIERLELAMDMLDGMKVTINERFKEIESREAVAHKSLTDNLNEAYLIQESLEKKFEDFEKLEKEFNTYQERKMQKLESKEQKLSILRKEVLKEARLRDEKLAEQQRLGHQLVESFEELVAKKLKEIESQKLTLNVAHEKLDASTKDADFKRESANMQLQELEKKEGKFRLYHEKKMRELVLAEEKLRLAGEEFVKEIKCREEEFDKQEKLVHGLLQRLESALNNVKDMNSIVSDRFKEIGLKEIELNYIKNQVEGKMGELKFAKELRGQENGIKVEEDGVVSKANEFEGKRNKRELKEGSSASRRMELESNKQHLEELVLGQNDSSSGIESMQTCFKENVALDKLHQPEQPLVCNHAGYLAGKDQQAECMLLRESELKRKKISGHLKKRELKLRHFADSRLKIEPDESVNLKRAVQIDGKALEMLINGAEKDFELMADEVFKVLLLSSDPAKLVLDAIEGSYRSHLGRGEVEFKKGRTCILLLDQLTKMSPKIQPCAREAAVKLANEWKSKMRAASENPLEVLGFLHLLAAYNLSSCFDKYELFGLLKTVAQHKQTPELFRILGLTEDIPGFIQNLLNEKQYLLASTYIYECELDNMFPQGAVLDYYVKHAKMLAKATCKREHSSSEAQDKAIVSEMADLRMAIEHIVKYGLESEYSPDTLTERIKHLERDRARLRNGRTSLSPGLQKQETTKRSAQAPLTHPSSAHKRRRKNILSDKSSPPERPRLRR